MCMSTKMQKVTQSIIPVLKAVNSSDITTCNFAETIEYLKATLLDVVVGANDLDAITNFEKKILQEATVEKQNACREIIEIVANCFDESLRKSFHISLNVAICQIHIETIKNKDKITAVAAIKKLIPSISSVVAHFQSSSLSKQSKTSTIFLCFHQLLSNLPLLVEAVDKDCNHVRQYASDCLRNCLSRIQVEICETSNLPCSEFLELMDSLLNQLEGIVENVNEWEKNRETAMKELKKAADEVLCHAMSAAQVANTLEDKQDIIGKAQTTLRALEDLKETSTLSLTAQTAIDSLCALERSVNATVLRLALDIKSNINDPLLSLMNMCRDAEQAENRQSADLDDLIADFDSHMDRLMQIGTFAVSCSSDAKMSLHIRSCLACFESLEAELVPFITSFYLDSCKTKKLTLRLLVKHWLDAIQVFRELLDAIIDPTAYAEVVVSSMQKLTKELDSSPDPLTIITMITKIAKTLQTVCNASLHQDSLMNESDIKSLIEFLHRDIECCERLRWKLMRKQEVTREIIERKVESLQSVIERVYLCLQRQLVDISGGESMELTSIKLPPPGDYYKLCPIDGDETSNEETDLLTTYKAQGRLMVKETILYNTPKRSVVRKEVFTPANTTLRRQPISTAVRSKCFRSKNQKRNLDTSQTDVTQFLEQLTELDGTFTTPRVSGLKGRRLLDLFDHWDSLLEADETSANGKEDGTTVNSDNIATPQREQDIEMVEKRIEHLKATPKVRIDDDYVTIVSIE